MATAPSGADRRIAAELAGWMPAEQPADWLESLVEDRDPDVETAALAALRRRGADAGAAVLIEALPRQPRSRQWGRLNALIGLSDPAHLTTPGDPRMIHDLLEALSEDFGQEAEAFWTAARKDLKSAQTANRRIGTDNEGLNVTHIGL